jgi:hypothetical protein
MAISSRAKACPVCGAPVSRGIVKGIVVLVLWVAVGSGVYAFIRSINEDAGKSAVNAPPLAKAATQTKAFTLVTEGSVLTIGPSGTIVCDEERKLELQAAYMSRTGGFNYIAGCSYLPKGTVIFLERAGRNLRVQDGRRIYWSRDDGFLETY